MEFHLSSQNLLSNPIIEMCNLLINKLFVAYYPLTKNTIQLVNFSGQNFVTCQYLLKWIKCLQQFMRQHHCTCTETCHVQKIKFYKINVCDFHCHQKFSSLHTFLVVRYDSTAKVHVSTLLNKQAL